MRAYSRDTETAPPTGIRIAQRERPATLHHSPHVDREAAEARVPKHAEFNANRVVNPTYLEAPPARHGYKQRWIRDGSGDDSEFQKEWWRKKRMGWQVRDPATVPPELRELYPSAKLSSGQDAIRVAHQVLCEIPIAVIGEKEAAVRDLINRQNQSVPPSTDELRKNPRAGVGPIQVNDEVHSARGTNPELRGRNLATMA